MEFTRFLDCLAADYDRMRTVVGTDADAAVPTCPGWTVADLTRHVGEVYLHKTAAMREGVEPEPWPPKEFAEEEPAALLDRGYTALRAEFATRAPGDAAAGWYGPDQSVGFWIRRMAQETVVHRIDAELATGRPVTPYRTTSPSTGSTNCSRSSSRSPSPSGASTSPRSWTAPRDARSSCGPVTRSGGCAPDRGVRRDGRRR